MARLRIDFFSRCDFELNLGLFVFEAVLEDGSAPALIRQIRNTDNLKDIPIVLFTTTDDEGAKLLEQFLISASQHEREKLEAMIGLHLRLGWPLATRKDHGQQ